MKIYCVPGLANDYRMFENLAPKLLSQNIEYLEHLPPRHLKESMEEYAQRLYKTIEAQKEEEAVIIGMSLGGMISVELSKLRPFTKVFLISTVKHPAEMPWQIKLARRLPLDKVRLPAWLLRSTVKPVIWMMGVTNSSGREHIKAMIDAADPQHIAWAQYAAANWQNDLIPDNYVHIHGSRDEIFPAYMVKASHFIKGGNHYMIMDRSDELAQIINQELATLMGQKALPFSSMK